MRAYKALAVILAIVSIMIIYVTFIEMTPEKENGEQGFSTSLQDCYEAAVECKEEDQCSKCIQICDRIEKESLQQKAESYCKLGQPQKIEEMMDKNNTEE